MKSVLATLVLALLSACNLNTDAPTSINDELNELVTPEDHREYLGNLKEKDQAIREIYEQLVNDCGKGSREARLSMQQIHQTDTYTIPRVKAYLDRFGWPDRNELEDLSVVPLQVLHHSPNYIDHEEYFDVVWDAYRNKQFDILWMSTFLERMHFMRFGTFSDLSQDCQDIVECKKLALGL